MRQVTGWLTAIALWGSVRGAPAVEWTSSRDAPWCQKETIAGLPPQAVADLVSSLEASRKDLRYCEVREASLEAPASILAIHGLQYGGIRVEGWSRLDVRLRVRVRVWGLPQEAAGEAARGVEIVTDKGTVGARGHSVLGEYVWLVDYDVRVPYESDLTLHTGDGGIQVVDLTGEIRAAADRGGIVLQDVAGDVRAQTVRGDVYFDLSTQLREGESVSLDSGAGKIEIRLAPNFAGELALGAPSGKVRVDFPNLVRGTLGSEVNLTVGHEGARIQATAGNGDVVVREH